TSLVHSTEYRENLVRACYRAYVNREPTDAERDYIVGVVSGGLDEDWVTAGMLGGGEDFAQHQNDTAGWLTAVYGVLLGRTPDATSYASNLAYVQGGGGHDFLVYGMMKGSEVHSWAITDAFAALLHRDPTTAEVAAWDSSLSGGLSVSEMVADIAA